GIGGELAFSKKLVADLLFFRHTQAIGNLYHQAAVEEGFIVLVILELQPFGLVGVRYDDALIREGAGVFRAVVVALLGGCQQRVQDLDGSLEHLDKLEHALGRAVEAAAVGISVRISLADTLK